MADLNQRDTKLVQYLSEALAKERELETALQLHIGMTTRVPYKKRLQQHLKETKGHARQVERRIKEIGGSSTVQAAQTTVSTAVGKGRAALKGQLDAVRGAAPLLGSAEQESMLKNARQEYMEEAAEIATYRTIEAFAEKVGDRDTARLAKSILREEQRMASFLERQIATLTNAVATAEVPAAQRSGGRRRRQRSRASGKTGSTKRRSTKRRSTARSRSTGGTGRGRSTSRSR